MTTLWKKEEDFSAAKEDDDQQDDENLRSELFDEHDENTMGNEVY